MALHALNAPALRAHEFSIPALSAPAPPPSVFSGAQHLPRPPPQCPVIRVPALCIPTLRALANEKNCIIFGLRNLLPGPNLASSAILCPPLPSQGCAAREGLLTRAG